jgi:hypothetical protein
VDVRHYFAFNQSELADALDMPASPVTTDRILDHTGAGMERESSDMESKEVILLRLVGPMEMLECLRRHKIVWI